MTYYQKYHVPAGTFQVNARKPLILQAYLNSCVGVALFDAEAGIGGLYHILLPEPVSHKSEYNREKYAATGLPLFLGHLVREGADISRLQAVIAGGALAGKVSNQDIRLDIGGRTAEVVKEVLGKHGIQVALSETGGFFTCCLNFNLETFDYEVIPALLSDEQEVDDTTHGRISKLDDIQPIPQVALKILRMIDEDAYDIHNLSQEVRKDQVISAQVLKYCNSAVFGGQGGIDSIDDALLIIGQTSLAKIVTAMAVKKLLNNSYTGYSLAKGGLYHHAIGVALVAEKIAALSGKASPFAAYSAGLIHDLGKVVLDQFVSGARPFFYREIMGENDLVETENRLLKTNHTKAGLKLAQKWDLPASITNTIRYHHTPDDAESHRELVTIISVSNSLFHMFSASPSLHKVDMNSLSRRLEVLGMSISDFPAIVDAIPHQVLSGSPELAIT
ncbi:HDOD domain-containing protein [Desulfoluna spongiiphila]|uniref:Probable chemoreceptor glutamine deamidase CheD n=1 Tax=Desulfoluna spongiiphila TaxID=419481 RepID=A0A1G5CP37_9BACT|nr:HDOD domain-containing protein [Desulfoluna spongiiphila]SCY04235.1 HDIG domain-containing protein [Desulfoluna spongiiphila]VVS92322.1 metal-dependent hydrolase hdod [Desulfoluna spongiiphila]